MKNRKIIMLVVGIILAVLGSLLVVRAWQDAKYREAHIFVEDAVYPKDSTELDLQGTGISIAHYEAVKEQLPECKIQWDVPFQGGFLPNDTTDLIITSLSDEDISILDHFPQLTSIDATGCTDYPQIMALKQRYPQCSITYQVTLAGTSYPQDTTALTFLDGNGEEFLEMLQYFPQLETLHFSQPIMAADALLALMDAYPNVSITWEKEVFGTVYESTVTELDFSGIPMDSIDYVEAAMAYFPNLEKLILCDCGIDNETMAQFRDRVRSDYKVVWSVKINTLTVRTDELTFMPEKHNVYVNDYHTKDLIYCEDMLCVDLGHKGVENLDWIYGMPHLQYLVLADTPVSDITPIGTLKELIYLELFKTNVTDYSPLVGCTALQDVNLACTRGDASVFAQMPWLNNLWINSCGVDQQTYQMLLEALPETTIEVESGWHLGNNWRAMLNYFKMRDLLEMPYYDWGNTLGRPGDPGYPYEETD